MAGPFDQKVVVITGASRGIGEHLARGLAARGARVVLAARSAEALQALVRRIGEPAMAVPTDVTRDEDVRRLAEAALERFGRIDVLVNNAGVGLTGTVGTLDLDALRRCFEVNVYGALRCIQAVLPAMRRQRSGHIVNVSSILGKLAVPQTAGYAATKHALEALSEGLRVEEAPWGIRVTVVCPGSTDTPFREHELQGGATLLAERPRYGLMQPEEAAERTIEAIRAGRREVVLGRFTRTLAAVHAVAPGLLDRVLARKYHGGR